MSIVYCLFFKKALLVVGLTSVSNTSSIDVSNCISVELVLFECVISSLKSKNDDLSSSLLSAHLLGFADQSQKDFFQTRSDPIHLRKVFLLSDSEERSESQSLVCDVKRNSHHDAQDRRQRFGQRFLGDPAPKLKGAKTNSSTTRSMTAFLSTPLLSFVQ